MAVKLLRIVFYLVICQALVYSEYSLFECPTGWDDFGEHCYRFMHDDVTITDAKTSCRNIGDKAYVFTINSEQEHVFIGNRLSSTHDPGQTKRDWWTSGRRMNENVTQFYWEGDGRSIASYFFWHNSTIPTQMDKDYILYNYNGFQWGWILGSGNEKRPCVCKISKEDIYQINDRDRGPDYGFEDPDPINIPRGPTFITQPSDTIFERVENPDITQNMVDFECTADGNPSPQYGWVKHSGSTQVEIDPSIDKRYTFVNGRLVIDKPSDAKGDFADYQCTATNEFGTIVSTKASLIFGYLNNFPNVPRSPVIANAYQGVSIECNPPDHQPVGDILFTWSKDATGDWVRPELKPYIFVSHDGRLYFSEVTTDDAGLYYCFVSKTGMTSSSGATSKSTELRVMSGSPGTFEPEIENGFPAIFPKEPIVGQTVRIECFARGTSRPPLTYTWRKVEDPNASIKRYLKMSVQAKLKDHNRVLVIPNAQLYDIGWYECSVSRMHGLGATTAVHIDIKAKPYFVLPLKSQYVDVGSTLRWRCEAGGDTSYYWLKNGKIFDSSTIPPGDQGNIKVSQNVLTITDLNAERDNGMYQCAAASTDSKLGVAYSSGELRVLSFAPSFAKRPLFANQFSTIKGNTTILCQPEAAPTPTIVWYKNGKLLNPSSDAGAVVRQMPNGNLFISPVSSQHAGVYKCEATNTMGEAQSTGNLTVLESVTISHPPETRGITVNKTGFVHCIASYNPQLDVTYVWYHGDAIIEFEKVYRLGENRYEVWYNPYYKRGSGYYVGGIYIMNTQYDQKGRYTCRVETTNGDKYESWADIIINGPPSEPAGVYIKQGTVTAITVDIRWKAAGSNGDTITSYVVEAYNDWEKQWRILHTNVQAGEAGELTVRNLRPFSLYNIRVRAENMYGTSIPSVPTDLFTTESVLPDLYPNEVGGGGGKVGTLVVTWKPLEPWQHNGDGFGYRVYWKNAGDAEWGERHEDVKGNAYRHVFLVFKDNYYRPYDVAVQAFNEKGFGPMSPNVTIRSAMKLPGAAATNVRSQPYNSTACLVHWEPTEDSRANLGGKLGGYRIAYWLESLGPEVENVQRVTLNGQRSEGLVIGLEPNTPYYFAVYVWNQAGNGPQSQHFIQRTLRRAPINQPVEVSVYKLDSKTIRVFWRGVSTTSVEEPLTGYKVRIWKRGEEIKVATDYNARKENDLKVSGLHPEIYYKLRVFAYSRGGVGTMSSPAIEFQLGSSGHIQACLALSLLLALLTLIINYLQ